MARRRLLKYYLYVLYDGSAYDDSAPILISPFAYTGGTDQFTVETNHPWSVIDQPAWVSLNVNSGEKGSTNITITASENTGTTQLTGNIVLQTDNERYRVILACTLNARIPTVTHRIDVVAPDVEVGGSGQCSAEYVTLVDGEVTERVPIDATAATWSVSDQSILDIDGSGKIIGLTPGTVNVICEYSGETGQDAVVVTIVPLSAITVEILDVPTIPASGGTVTSASTGVAYRITAIYRDGTTQDITNDSSVIKSGNTVSAESLGSGVTTEPTLCTPKLKIEAEYQGLYAFDDEDIYQDINQVESRVITSSWTVDGEITTGNTDFHLNVENPSINNLSETGGTRSNAVSGYSVTHYSMPISGMATYETTYTSQDKSYANEYVSATTSSWTTTNRNEPVTVRSKPTWVTNVTTGTSGQFTYEATTGDVRTGEIVYHLENNSGTSKTTQLLQAGTYGISVWPFHYEDTQASGLVDNPTVDLTGLTTWRLITPLPGWISINPSAGTNGSSFELYIHPNDATERRPATGEIEIYFSGYTEGGEGKAADSILVSQVAHPYEINAYFGDSGEETQTYVDSEQQDIRIRLYSNQAWTGSCSESWVTFVGASTGTGNNPNLTVRVQNNTGGARNATITFTGEHGQTCQLTLNQSAYVPIVYDITANYRSGGYEYSAGTESDSKEIVVSAVNQGWYLADKPGWISIDETSGAAGETIVTISWGENTGEARGGNVVFSGSVQGGDYVKIYQEAAPLPEPDFVWDSNDESTISAATMSSGASSDYETYSVTGYTNVGYDSSDVPSWLHVSMSNGTFSFSADAQAAGGSARDCTITITATSYNNIGAIYIEQEAAEAKRLTDVTLTILSIPEVLCTGGNVSTGSVTYEAWAWFSDGTRVPANVEATPSAGISVPSWGSVHSDEERTAGTITYTASYTFEGATLDDEVDVEIVQNANPYVESGVTGYGRTDVETETGEKYGTSYYGISCSPSAETVSSAATSVTVTVTATEYTPTTAFTYDTYYPTSAYSGTLCTNAAVHWGETGDTRESGATAQTSVYTATTEALYNTTQETGKTWASYVQEDDEVTVSVVQNTDSSSTRSVLYTFRTGSGQQEVGCTFELTQEEGAPRPISRRVKFSTNHNVTWNNASDREAASTPFTITSMTLSFKDLSSGDEIWSAEYNAGGQGIRPGDSTEYPDGRDWTTSPAYQNNQFFYDIDYGTTLITFIVEFDNILGPQVGQGEPISYQIPVTIYDDIDDYDVILEEITWYNRL